MSSRTLAQGAAASRPPAKWRFSGWEAAGDIRELQATAAQPPNRILFGKLKTAPLSRFVIFWITQQSSHSVAS
jgi:hypothetical protein